MNDRKSWEAAVRRIWFEMQAKRTESIATEGKQCEMRGSMKCKVGGAGVIDLLWELDGALLISPATSMARIVCRFDGRQQRRRGEGV